MKDVKNSSVVFRFLAEPSDVNFGGKVHGGAVMRWIDQTAFTCAAKWSSSYCVTVYVGGIRFMKPIRIGDMVEVLARLIYTGRSSMHIAVDIKSINPRTKEENKTTHCIIIFSAIDEDGKTVQVPTWKPRSEEEKAWHEYGLDLIEKRKDINLAMEEHLGDYF